MKKTSGFLEGVRSLVSTIFSYKETATSNVWEMAFQGLALLQSKRKSTFEEEAWGKMSHKRVRMYPEILLSRTSVGVWVSSGPSLCGT